MSPLKTAGVICLFLFCVLMLLVVGTSDGCGVYAYNHCISLFTIVSPIPGIVASLVLLSILFQQRIEDLKNEFDASNIADPVDYDSSMGQMLAEGCFPTTQGFEIYYEFVAT